MHYVCRENGFPMLSRGATNINERILERGSFVLPTLRDKSCSQRVDNTIFSETFSSFARSYQGLAICRSKELRPVYFSNNNNNTNDVVHTYSASFYFPHRGLTRRLTPPPLNSPMIQLLLRAQIARAASTSRIMSRDLARTRVKFVPLRRRRARIGAEITGPLRIAELSAAFDSRSTTRRVCHPSAKGRWRFNRSITQRAFRAGPEKCPLGTPHRDTRIRQPFRTDKGAAKPSKGSRKPRSFLSSRLAPSVVCSLPPHAWGRLSGSLLSRA